MTEVSKNLLYLILFVVGLVVSGVLFLFTPKNRLLSALLDLPRTIIVGGVFVLVVHFLGSGYVGASTIIPYASGALISLVATQLLHNKRIGKRVIKD